MGIIHRTGEYQGNDPQLKGHRALIRFVKGYGLCDAQFTTVEGRSIDKIPQGELPIGVEKYQMDWHAFALSDFKLLSEDE